VLFLSSLLGCAQVTDRALFAALDEVDDDDDDAADDDDSVGDDDDSGGDDDDAAPCDTSFLVEAPEVSLAGDLEPMFAVHCDPCHTFQELGGMSLLPGQAHGDLVDQPNTLQYGGGMVRVEAGNPEGSYLMHKVIGCEGTDATWGYTQGPMPPTVGETMPLSDEQISQIWSWILQGAQDN